MAVAGLSTGPSDLPPSVEAGTSGEPPAVSVAGLRKEYGDLVAVRDLSLTLSAGRILGLVGPNGAGKTTTLHCLSGILAPSAGSVSVCGIDVAARPVEAKRLLSFIPDVPQLFEYLTVEQHLNFVARLYHVDDWRELGESLLAEFELTEKRDRLPHELSRGMKQKLAICCGFLPRPRLILFDEPLTGLDPIGIRRIKASIARRAAQGAAIVVSSHLLELVRELSDELLVLQGGVRVAGGTFEELRARYPELPEEASLEQLFLHVVGAEGE